MHPLFLLGCPRSGTTIIRNYIKARTKLISPEETYYYRWSFPFGSSEFLNQVNSALSKMHRSIDNVDESEFQDLLRRASSRKELLLGHIRLMAGEQALWFEKTPQHVYAAPLLKADFPNARLVFIFRNPLNACASLYQGRQVNVGSLTGSIAYWKESYSIYKVLHNAIQGITLLKYEDFVDNPDIVFKDLMKQIDYRGPIVDAPSGMVAKKPNERGKVVFTETEKSAVMSACSVEMAELGY